MARVVKLSTRDAQRKFQQLGSLITEELVHAEEENILDALRTAQSLSQGSISPRELRKFHPYAKNRVNARLWEDPAVINIHSEGFLEGWETEGPHLDGNSLTTELFNRSPEADFILAPGGTEYMVERPILKRVVARIATRVGQRRRQAFRKAAQRF